MAKHYGDGLILFLTFINYLPDNMRNCLQLIVCCMVINIY